MAEGNPVKSFYVQLPGYQQGEVWDEEKYNRNKEQLFKDHQDAMVVETSPLAQDEVIKDDGMFTVKLPGYEKGELWDGAKLNRNREQLLKDHPDAVITKASPVNYWGDKLTDISTKIDALENELKGMPNEERHLGMNISDADALDVITDTPERRRRNQINTELDQLYRERESNPAWQTYWDKQKEELRGSIQKAKEDADISKGVSVKNEKGKYDIRQYGSSVESDYFKTAQQLYKDALKTAEAPSKYDDSLGIVNFARGAAENIGSAVTMLELAKAMKMTNVIGTVKQIQEAEGENVNLIDLIQNHPDRLSYLSPGQKEVMNAFIKRAEIEQGRSGDMSIGYQAGAGAIQSLGFMGDFLLTGGAGSAAGKAVAKKVAKATTEELAEKSLAGITKKMLVGNLEGATKSLVMTPLMPSSYSNFINSLAQLDSNGGMDLSGKAVLNSIGDTLIETFSENAGDLFGIPFEGKLFDSISKSKLGEIGKAMGRTGAGRLLKDAGWHGMVGEMAEEVLGNAMRTVTGIDENALKNFFSKDELLTTLASFAPMSIIGAGASMHQVRKAGKSMAKDGEKLQNILRSFELDEDQIKNLLDVSGYETPEQLGSAIAKIGKTAADAGKITQENAQEFGMALGNYVMSASKYKVLQGVFEDEQDAVRAQNTALIDEEVGDSSWYHQGEEGNYVRTITDADGNQRFVVSSDEGQLALVGRDGSKSFLTNEELEAGIADGTLTDSGEQAINDYLDGISENDQKAAEEQRMAEETSSQITAIQERIAADPTINMGTEEAPKMAVVDAANANGVHVTWQDEDGAKDATLTWEQVGNYLGTPVEVKTDEQIEQEEIQAEDDIRSRKEDYNKHLVPGKTEFDAVLVEGEAPVTYVFQRAFIGEDGNMMLQVTDKETGKDEQITEEMALQGNLTSVLDSLKTPEEIQAEEVQTEEEAPQEEDNTLRDFRGNPIPLKDDGSVNQTALWNADPEAWARWNDSQRNDGGANSRGYIAKATKKLQSDAKAVQKQIDNELDFDRISELEGQLGQINSRIADLERIENNYANAEVAQTEAVETPAEAPAPVAETTEAAPIAEAAQTQGEVEAAPEVQEEAAPLTPEQALESRLAEAKTPEEKRQALEEYYALTTTDPTVVGTRADILQRMAELGFSERVIGQVRDQLNAEGTLTEGFHIGDMVFIVADDIRDARRARLAHLHEHWHEVNRQKGYQKVVASIPGATTEYLLAAANKMAGVSDNNGYGDYLDYANPQQALADEVIALSMEVVAESTPENVDDNLRNAGLDNQEIINFVKTIYNGERGNDQTLDSSGRDTLSGDNAQEGERQDGGDSASQPEGNLGEQGSGSGEGSDQGTEGAGGEVTPQPDFRVAILDTNGIAANGDEVRFSVRYIPQASEIDGIAQEIADQVGVSTEEARRWIQSETSLAAIITGDSAILDYEGDDRYTAIKQDADYPQGTVDFNNICRKRLAFTEMYQRVQKAFPNTIITGEDLATIRNIMKDHGLTVACGLCYVEDRRQLLGEIAKDFIDNVNSNFEIYASRGGETKKKNAEKFRKLIGEDSKADLSVYDLITLEGSGRLLREHPGLYRAFQAFNNARGQQAGNLFQGYAEYKREILKWNKKKVKSVNDNGGLRIFSYSDFEAHHLIDLVQIIQDCARKGVKIQGYTKVPAFARAVAQTGVKLNRSLIPLGDTGIVDGKLAYDSVEGIDINDPNFLPSNDNIGNILIGINDEQIRLAMADPFINFIIPYHSNQKDILRSMKQTGAWTNYKYSQTEKDANGRTAENVNIYTDVLNAAEAEGNPITTERQFTEKFLEVCKERGLTPRFAQFLDQNENGDYVYTPGYYKFLVDFKLFDEQGNLLPQNPVKAIFDDQFNAQILNDYVKDEREKLGENLDDVYNEIVQKLNLENRKPDIELTPAQRSVMDFIDGKVSPIEAANATQKQPASEATEPVVTEEDVMFRLSKSNKATVESWLKKREDLNDEQRAEVVDYIDKLDDAKTQLATAKWFANGTIRIPEDMKKVQQAISVSGKAKVDPLRYNSPMELLDAHADFKPSEERINPDEVSTLHRAEEYPQHGIVVYDVDNTKESRENMRKIINTHFGEDASPWCLLQGDGKGNLTADSARYWRHYNAYPKQVAFKDGKLLAFSANDRKTRLWWDRKDESHYGIPITQKMEGDELGRSANYIIEEGQLVKEPGSHLFRGNRQNGVYEEWSTDGNTILERTNYKNGEEDGLTEAWYPNGQMQRRTTMKDGNYVGRYEAWFDNGQKQVDMTLTEEGFNDGERRAWWKNGNPRSEGRYKKGLRVGEHRSWDEEGFLTAVQYYNEESDYLGFEDHNRWGIERKVTFTEDNGQIDERYYRGGRLVSVARTKNGKLEGLQEYFYADGVPQTRSEYSNGERNGIFERYHPNGKLMAKGEYKNGEREGIHELYSKDGDLISRQEYHNDEKVRTLPLDENVQFRLSNMQEMDQEFEAAYNNNDEDTAQRMVDEMAEAAGYTIRGYHGTTHDFTIFDRSKGNAEGNWGRGFYFTNNEDDAEANYAGEGPDLTNRIELLAENMEWMDGYEDMDYEQRLEEARKQLAGDNPHVISAAIRMENPVVFDSRGGQQETYFDYNENYNEETEEYEGEPTGRLVDFVEAWNDVLSDWEWEGNNVSPDEILEYANYEGLTATQLEDKAREILAYVENSEGQVATGEFLRQVFERMGFDGIVDNNVNQKFGSQRRYGRGMDGVDYGTTHVIAFQPNQIKQADPFTFDDEGKLIPLSKRFDSWNDDIRFRKANQTQNGFISNAEMALDKIKMEKATPEQWIKMLEKEGGLKAGEDKWLGLSDWLKESDKKTLTKDEIGDFIEQNRIQIEEQRYSEAAIEEQNNDAEKALERYRDEYEGFASEWRNGEVANSYGWPSADDYAFDQMVEKYGDDFRDGFQIGTMGQLEPIEGYDDDYSDAAKYFLGIEDSTDERPINSVRLDYTTPGLSNKREIALTVPTIDPWNESDMVHFGDAGEGRAVAWIRFGDAWQEGELMTEAEKEGLPERYRGQDLRWKPKRVLVIDEIQSKRHQEGREKGYQDEALEKKRTRRGELSNKSYSEEGLTFDEYKEFKALQEELGNIGVANVYRNRNAIPAAPFEKNWHELAMKRMLRLAAEEGYDKIAWTTGDQQAERYNIGGLVESIDVKDQDNGVRDVTVRMKDAQDMGFDVDEEGNVLAATDPAFVGDKTLADYLGKELAVRALSAESGSSLSGDGLRVGGEGMNGFYDDILPRFMNKYGKKWGVKVQDVALSDVYDETGRPLVMHSVDVTPEMKESVMEGQVMFSLRGIIGAENAEDEAALDNLEVAEEMENAGKDSPTIWRATGWERGADGKWRNEIPDAKQKEGVSLQKHNIAGEILDAPELFDSYPELAEMPIDLVNSAAAGAYNREQKRITLDTDYNTTFEMSKEDKKKVEDSTIDFIRNGSWKRQSDITKFKNGLSEQYGKLVLNSNGIGTILHELQHAIQHIEGFAKGTNEEQGERLYYKEALKTKPEETYFAWFLSRKNSAKKLNQVGRERVIRYAENYDKSNLTEQDKEYFNKLIDYLKGMSDDEYKKFVTRAAKVVKTAEKAGEESYEKSAGEVEARNVERRSTLSDKKRQKYSPEATEEYSRGEQIVLFRKVTDPATLERLESEEKIPIYASKQFIEDPNGDAEYDFGDGRGAVKGFLVAPMSGKVEGKWRDPERLGDFQEAEERPDLVNEKGEFLLDKGNGDTLKVAYAPYNHLRRSPLNEQFSSAYKRPNLVIVKGEIPASELTSGYTAEKSKKSTGEHDWPSGKVSNALAKKGQDTRKVILSRWFKPIEVVPASKVADEIVKKIDDAGIKVSFNYNVVTPTLRRELVKRGVKFSGWQGQKPDDWKEQVQRMQEENNDIVLFRRSQELFNESREGGLTGLIGDQDASELYRNVYRAIPKEIRERIVSKAGDGFLFSEAAKEMISEAVEKGDETGIAGLASNILRDYVGPLDERTARYILWRGDRKAEDDDLLDTVKDITMQRRLQVGQFADPAMFRLSDNLEEAENRAESMADDAQQTKDEKKEFAKVNDALTTIKAMSLQKEYDRKTVNTITVLAKNVLKDQSIETLSRHEIARLLGIITTSIGKAPKTVKKNADALVGLIVDHLLRSEETKLGMLANTKASKTNQAGVEVQGALDVRGQNVLKAYKAGLDMDLENPEDEFDGNTIKGRLNTLSDRLSSEDDAVRSEAEDEYAGLMLAQEYQEKIKASINEERGLKNEMKEAAEAYRDGDISRTSYNQFVEESEKSVRENKIERIEAYRDLRLKMLQMMEGSIDARKEFTEREKQRVEEIHHLANSDMQGEDASPFKEPTRMGRFANSSIVRFFSKPLITFDQMLRLFGQKNVAGEGYLFNKFHRGWIDATEKAYLGDKQAKEELDAKVSEVFDKKMRWSDLYAEERKMPTVKVKWWDGGQMKEHELTQGNLLYIYMVNKMTDGRMKLRRMGITEETVDAIKRQMDSRFIELADWLQEEYLVNKRNKYNAVHERLFGASMAAIEDYFPLKINKRSLNRAEDIGRPEFDDALPATTTGSIIKRRRNAQDLDLLGADAFSVVIEHVEQMEQWAAFAEFNKDLNTLLSYKRFRNQVQNMATVYGSGSELWRNFKAVCRVAGGAYNPAGKKSDLDTAALNIAKGVTAAKISFRVYTALKQFLSMPAFVSDANIKYLGENMATPWKAWNWAMENLPLFEKRWKSRQAGDTRLMKTESDWKLWRNKIVEKASQWGMSPNAFVDALTVSIGAHSIYQSRYDRYIKDGYTEAQADKKAKQDATTLYNETQQSNEAAFTSPVQLDRTVLATMLTVFRNSSMGYQRQLHDAIRNIGKMMKPGYKASSIEFMKKQMVRDGLTEEQAEHAANRNYNREIWRSAARIGTFGFLVEFAWNLGGSIAYLLFGDDDDKKDEMLTEALIHGLIGGTIEGLAGGNVMSEALNMVAKGESLNNYDPSLLPIISDMKSAYKKMSYDPVAGANDLFNLAVQAGIGVNPQTITDAVVAVVDACGGDLDTSKEVMLLAMRVLQVPQSQVDQIYIDELGTNAAGARRMSVSEMAERYARYKVAKGAPITGWAYSDEAEEKREKAYLKRFKKLVKERKSK